VLSVNSGGLMTAHGSSGSANIITTCQGITAHGLVTLNPVGVPALVAPPGTPQPRPGGPSGPQGPFCPGPVPTMVDCIDNLPRGRPTAICVDGAYSCSPRTADGGNCSSGHRGVQCWYAAP
jgi:hypothetical protein